MFYSSADNLVSQLQLPSVPCAGQGSQGSPSTASTYGQTKHTKTVFITFSVPLPPVTLKLANRASVHQCAY